MKPMKKIPFLKYSISVFISILLLLLGIGLLRESAAVSGGVRRGLLACAQVLIPSLFPFMALSGFLSVTSFGSVLSLPLRPLTTRLYKLPPDMGALVLLSLVGGYPVGARAISSMLSQGKIDKATAERMLCFCVNCGPSFLITAVGAGMLLDKTAGVILFATQTLATLLIGIFVSRRTVTPDMRVPQNGMKIGGGAAFVEAVSGASSAMIQMCAFAVLFSGLLPLVESTGVVNAIGRIFPAKEKVITAILRGLFEVTAGCVSASGIGGEEAFLLVSAFVSFGGLSVIFQISSCFRGQGVRLHGFLTARLIHIPLAAAMALPLYQRFCASEVVWRSDIPPVMNTNWQTALMSLCLTAMCTILLFSPESAGGSDKKLAKKHKLRYNK